MKVGREFYWDAAHSLPHYKGKCEDLHGHTYKLEVVVEGEAEEGMVLDFSKLKKVVKEKVIEELDHKNLNDLFQNPTCENIAQWIFKKLKEEIPLHSVKLWEGEGKWALVE